MKKMMIPIIILQILFLFGCSEIKTYDDLIADYQNHLELREDTYSRIFEQFNSISDEVLEAIVLIQVNNLIEQKIVRGSGVIYAEDELSYYIMTNHHVVHVDEGISVTYYVDDYAGNRFEGELLYSLPEYDLGILKIDKGDLELKIITFAQQNESSDETAYILGYPSIKTIAITAGKIMNYNPIEIPDVDPILIDVSFDVLILKAPVKSGSSGSLVINDSNELIGIIYAGLFSDDDISEYAFAIPLQKVNEFLALYLNEEVTS